MRIFSLVLIILLPLPLVAQEYKAPDCDGPYKNGTKLTERKLKEVLDRHLVWREALGDDKYPESFRANLCGADLFQADLSGRDLVLANLSGAMLNWSNLSHTDLRGTNLSGVDLYNANLKGALYEPNPGEGPPIDSIALSSGLSTLEYDQPRALFNLRKQFRDAGYDFQAREITYALHKGRTRKLLEGRDIGQEQSGEASILNRLKAVLNYIAFDLTTRWGMEPGRALYFLLLLIPVFSLGYTASIWSPKGDGIWRIWASERVRKDLGSDEPELISLKGFAAFKLAFYFSILSAFHIGWRDFNVGSWISRIQSREYTFKASGWARTVSGIQSLLSVYLLALWALTTFGSPFG